MTVYIAKKTLKAIADTMRADQGANFRTTLQKVLPHMGDAYRGEDAPFRSHMGASQIGNECGRAIWYNFHWTTKPKFEGRILRLFNRGHLEEARFISLLLMIGCQVFQQDENGNQFRISDAGGHFGGSGDGVAKGVPDIPAEHHCLLEFKTHNDKSFKKLKSVGVREAKFEHYVQMQTYMRKMGLTYGLYMAVNKNDDDIHAEIVVADPEIADQFIERGKKLVWMKEAPSRISNSPGWFACSWCDHKPVCHNGASPEVNCRTCAYSEPRPDGKWWCNNEKRQLELLFPESNPLGEDYSLTKERQLTGCNYWLINPNL